MNHPSHINLDVKIPFNDKYKINSFYAELREIVDKYVGGVRDKNMEIELEYNLKLLAYRDEYRGILISSKDVTRREDWPVDHLLLMHQRYCPDQHEIKKTYRRMDINNMLWDLMIRNIIISYEQVAYPFETSLNEREFNKYSVWVKVPAINIGDKEMYNLLYHYNSMEEENISPKEEDISPAYKSWRDDHIYELQQKM